MLSDEQFPYSTYYKMIAVVSLEIAIGINVIVVFAWIVFIVPRNA